MRLCMLVGGGGGRGAKCACVRVYDACVCMVYVHGAMCMYICMHNLYVCMYFFFLPAKYACMQGACVGCMCLLCICMRV